MLAIAASGMLIALLATACGTSAGEPPELRVDRTACDHCSMLISDTRYAAAYRLAGETRVFDDVGCLLAELREEPRADAARVWFRDFEEDRWISASAARFVRVSFHTPMGGGIVAVEGTGRAGRFAAVSGEGEAQVLESLADLLDGSDIEGER